MTPLLITHEHGVRQTYINPQINTKSEPISPASPALPALPASPNPGIGAGTTNRVIYATERAIQSL